MSKSDEIIYELYSKYYLREKDVKTLIKLLIAEKDLGDVVENIVLNENSKHLGEYIIKDKTILINTSYIIDNSHSWMNTYLDQYSERLSIRFANLQILETIIHELRHAKQVQVLNSKENTPIKTIIQESIDLLNSSWIRKKVFYKLHKNCILIERDAYISSLIELLSIDEKLSIVGPFEKYEYIYSNLIKLIQNGYSKSSSPSKTFFKLRNKLDVYDSFNSYIDDYDDITKLSWGLPIPYQEVKDKEKVLTKILQSNKNK